MKEIIETNYFNSINDDNELKFKKKRLFMTFCGEFPKSSFNITKKKQNTQNLSSLIYCFLSCVRKTPSWLAPEFEVSEIFLSLVVSDFMDGEETCWPSFALAPAVTERLQSGQHSNYIILFFFVFSKNINW